MPLTLSEHTQMSSVHGIAFVAIHSNAVARDECHTWVLVRVVHADSAATDTRTSVTTISTSIDNDLMNAWQV